jgi:biotin-dependent carboxylase-like uncharacterized protein
MSLRILWAGPSSTVQDAGRFGYRRFGVPVAGAADEHAYRLANLIVGNAGGEAVIESTLAGPTVEFSEDCAICATGARFAPRLNGVRMDMGRAVFCRAGDVLEMGAATAGCRGYLAVFGGINVPLVMGSRSTYVRAGLGGHMGRTLRDGDVLPVGSHGDFPGGLSLRHADPRIHEERSVLRALLGPQDDLFSRKVVDQFFAGEYVVENQSDRMGVRLAGAGLAHLGDGNIVSDGVSAGAIQIPGDGQPIVMLADGQTTGGYPKIAYVATVDLPILAQFRPGDRVRFAPVSEDEAQALYIARLREYEALRLRLDAVSARARDFDIKIAGTTHRVSIVPADEPCVKTR